MIDLKYRMLLLVLMFTAMSKAQVLPDSIMKHNFRSQVKSLDEFIQRFNAVELHPDSDSRYYNLISLFDYEVMRASVQDSLVKRKIEEFVEVVDSRNVMIKLTDGELYAEIDVEAIICEKRVMLKLYLQSQTYREDRTRWAIVGAKGLVDSGLIETQKFYGISPVDHEIHFLGLDNIFENNLKEIMGYRGKDTLIDELSVLLTMAMLDKVRIVSIDNLTFHCLQVPGYIFKIKESNKSSNNSGWLISKLMECDNEIKSMYVQKLLGK